jgi:DNA-binding MarR family transcriptional regulator
MMFWFIFTKTKISRREICRINNVVKATLSVVINGLVRKDLIRRERNISDPRKNKLVLTEKVHHLRPNVLRIKADAYHALVAGLSQVHLERLTEDLRQLLDNLERIK